MITELKVTMAATKTDSGFLFSSVLERIKPGLGEGRIYSQWAFFITRRRHFSTRLQE